MIEARCLKYFICDFFQISISFALSRKITTKGFEVLKLATLLKRAISDLRFDNQVILFLVKQKYI